MKTPRGTYLSFAGLCVVGALVAFFVVHREPKRPVFTSTTNLVAGLQAFIRDHVTQGKGVPDEVYLTNLVTGGYLSSSDVAGFDGMKDVTFTTRIDTREAPPFLAWARTSDGQYVCLISDGSAQLYSATKFQEAMQAFRRQATRSPSGGSTGSGTNGMIR